MGIHLFCFQAVKKGSTHHEELSSSTFTGPQSANDGSLIRKHGGASRRAEVE